MASAHFLVTTAIIFMASWLLLLVISPTVEGRRSKGHKHDIPTPSFLPTESNYTYHKGDRAILYCSIKNLGTKTVIWRRAYENSPPLTIGTMTYVDDDRYEVAHIDESPDWNLMISNVSTAETGGYECQVSAVDRELRKEVYLHVKDEFSYREPSISISGTFHVDKGMPMTLVCNATGTTTPPDYIDWFKDGSKITTDKVKRIDLTKQYSLNTRTITSTLVKGFAQMTDTGTYVCRTSDLQVTSVKVNVLNTDKRSRKRVLKDPVLSEDGQCTANCQNKPGTGEMEGLPGSASLLHAWHVCVHVSVTFMTLLLTSVQIR